MRGYTQLTQKERYQIYILNKAEYSQAEIAELLERDKSTINLCLSAFPWANFRTTKGAIKLHVGMNHAGYLPEFVTITNGKTSDIEAGRALQFPKAAW